MRRTTLMVAAAGGVAALATTGAALGVAASDSPAPPRSASLVAAETTAPSPEASSPSAAPPAAGRVGTDQAARIALRWTGGGRVTEIEAEFEHGRPAWEVELVNDGIEHEVYVDRETGAVIKAEREPGEHRRGHDSDDRHDGDHSGPGSGDDSDDHSGRDHPEDD